MPCELEFFGKNLNVRSIQDRVKYRLLGKSIFHDETDMVFSPKLSVSISSRNNSCSLFQLNVHLQ